jgi:putative phosphoribosyl transferase
MHYFTDRIQAGRILADKLAHYEGQDCTVMALSEGGMLIGSEIASRIHASLCLLVIENIEVDGEPDPIGLMSSSGSFIYNTMFSAGQLEEMVSDYRQIIDQERLETFHKINRIVGKDGIIDKNLLKNHVVILVSDGLKNGLSLDVAADFIKTLKLKKLIVATPIASVPGVERMHLVADEIYCLGVADNYFTTNHYYQNNNLPDHEIVMQLMKSNIADTKTKE